MTENRYCNNDDIKDEILRNYKSLIQKTKILFIILILPFF